MRERSESFPSGIGGALARRLQPEGGLIYGKFFRALQLDSLGQIVRFTGSPESRRPAPGRAKPHRARPRSPLPAPSRTGPAPGRAKIFACESIFPRPASAPRPGGTNPPRKARRPESRKPIGGPAKPQRGPLARPFFRASPVAGPARRRTSGEMAFMAQTNGQWSIHMAMVTGFRGVRTAAGR
jgi:hypothetical protein